jgi:hypothetical protein
VNLGHLWALGWALLGAGRASSGWSDPCSGGVWPWAPLGRLGALGPGWVAWVPRLGAPAPGVDGLVSDWRDDAACLGDPEPGDWFATPAEGDRLERAMAVCLECPVAVACLEFALAVDERWGVWVASPPRSVAMTG